MAKNNTEYLNKKLMESKDVKSFIEENKTSVSKQHFSDELYALIDASGKKNTEIFQSADIAESTGYQILSGKRNPSRDVVIQLAFALELGINDTNRLLKLAEKSALYVKNKRDALLIFAINNRYSLMATNELLTDEDCHIL